MRRLSPDRAGLLSLVVREIQQIRSKHRPILNLRLFRSRSFCTAFGMMFVLGSTLYATTVLLPRCLSAVSFCSAADSIDEIPVSTQHLMGSHQTAPGLPNFGQVTPRLFRGAQPERNGYKTLYGMGINIVVDMSGNRSEESSVEKLGMQYVSIPWNAHSPSDEIIARFLKVIEENPDKKIFVHCHAGVDRTGMAIASYRIAREGWSAGEAMKEMQLFGFSRFHTLRFATLVRFEKDFPEHLKTSSAFQELHAISR